MTMALDESMDYFTASCDVPRCGVQTYRARTLTQLRIVMAEAGWTAVTTWSVNGCTGVDDVCGLHPDEP